MKSTSLQTLVASVILTTSSFGSGVNWSSPFFDSLQMVDSTGNLLDASYAFELGTFADGFVPTSANLDQWAAKWKLLSRSDTINGKWDPAGVVLGPNFDNGFSFASTGEVNGLPSSALFTAGEQAYIWAFNNNEWALVTDLSPGSGPNAIWQLPNPALINDFPLSWNLQDADTAVVGSVNNGTYRLQTQVVPEPSTTVLVLLIGGLVQLSRHKRRYRR
ncbi:MAG: PEP-CTERM sorting domain-containing protein [Verrucomicrobiaceae bacterium]|nr:PEP-CTERM sorting domain-containing protein [Verrucomicrobiaceae bacterium]